MHGHGDEGLHDPSLRMHMGSKTNRTSGEAPVLIWAEHQGLQFINSGVFLGLQFINSVKIEPKNVYLFLSIFISFYSYKKWIVRQKNV